MWQRKFCSWKKYRYGGWFTTSKDNPVKVLWFNPCVKKGKIVIATEPCVFVGGLSIDLYSGNMDIVKKVLSKSIFYLVECESTKQIYNLGIKICDFESAAGQTQSSYREPLGGCLEDGIIIDKDETNITVACGPTVYDLPVTYFNDTVELLQCASFILNAPRGTAAVQTSGEFSVWDLCTWDVHYPKLKFAPWLANSGFYYYYSPGCTLANSKSTSRTNSICDSHSSRFSNRRNSTSVHFGSRCSSNSSLYSTTLTNNLKRKKGDSSWIANKFQKKETDERVLLYSEIVKIPEIESIS
ncbi:unnamed protein product [Meganyctiphanes norvegica]|uniref:Uncharacterized protein n=1 Tax=Meganyctiphanes norvegica TaxID=48144 RepID=A0AAV2RMB8_MEGNR